MRMMHYCIMAVVALLISGINVASAATPTTKEIYGILHVVNNKPLMVTREAINNVKILKETLAKLNMTSHYDTLVGIILVETRAGMGGSIGLPTAHWTRRSYGLMQITLPTARVMFERYPERFQHMLPKNYTKISNEHLIRLLINNKELNVTLGATVFDLYLQMTKGEWARAVAAYNMGIGAALKRPNAPKVKYVSDTKSMMKFVPLLNVTVEELYNTSDNNQDSLPDNKENNNGKEQTDIQSSTEAEHSEQSGRTEEVQDNVSNDYASHANDRRSERSDQGNN